MAYTAEHGSRASAKKRTYSRGADNGHSLDFARHRRRRSALPHVNQSPLLVPELDHFRGRTGRGQHVAVRRLRSPVVLVEERRAYPSNMAGAVEDLLALREALCKALNNPYVVYQVTPPADASGCTEGKPSKCNPSGLTLALVPSLGQKFRDEKASGVFVWLDNGDIWANLDSNDMAANALCSKELSEVALYLKQLLQPSIDLPQVLHALKDNSHLPEDALAEHAQTFVDAADAFYKAFHALRAKNAAVLIELL